MGHLFLLVALMVSQVRSFPAKVVRPQVLPQVSAKVERPERSPIFGAPEVPDTPREPDDTPSSGSDGDVVLGAMIYEYTDYVPDFINLM